MPKTQIDQEYAKQFGEYYCKDAKNKENDKKEKENPQIGEISWVKNKLPLKLEVKIELKLFGREMDLKQLNQWFKQMEAYFWVQKIKNDEERIEIATFKLKAYGSSLVGSLSRFYHKF